MMGASWSSYTTSLGGVGIALQHLQYVAWGIVTKRDMGMGRVVWQGSPTGPAEQLVIYI